MIGVIMIADLFHVGHLNVLRQAHQLAKSKVVVGIHGDEDVAKYKRRPIIPEEERKAILESCRFVDRVEIVPFSKHGIRDFLVNNDIKTLVRGDDWTDFPGKDVADELGINIHYVPYTHGVSSTDIIERCRVAPAKFPDYKERWKEIYV